MEAQTAVEQVPHVSGEDRENLGLLVRHLPQEPLRTHCHPAGVAAETAAVGDIVVVVYNLKLCIAVAAAAAVAAAVVVAAEAAIAVESVAAAVVVVVAAASASIAPWPALEAAWLAAAETVETAPAAFGLPFASSKDFPRARPAAAIPIVPFPICRTTTTGI